MLEKVGIALGRSFAPNSEESTTQPGALGCDDGVTDRTILNL